MNVKSLVRHVFLFDQTFLPPQNTIALFNQAGKPTGYNSVAGLHGVSGGDASGITDGNSYSGCGWGCCVHTSDWKTDPFVFVDLEETQTIDRVRIESGPAYTVDWSDGMIIAVSDVPFSENDPLSQFSNNVCKVVPSGLSVQYTFDEIVCDAPVTGRYVGMLVPGTSKIVMICEFEVYLACGGTAQP